MSGGRAISASIVALALAACSWAPQGGVNPAARGIMPTAAVSGSLFVANRHAVTVYDLEGGGLIRSISNSDPTAIAVNHEGNLFVANYQANTITVYAHGGTSVLRTITQGLDGPRALAFDRSENLYVANNLNKTVTVYAPKSATILRTISDGVKGPEALVFSKSGNLFVGNNGSSHITVYPPGGVHVIRTIITHNGPLALALNPAQDLFSVNNFNVTVYKPGTTSPYRTISDGISLPSTLAFDSAGNLYVANWGVNMFRSSISIYLPGQSSPTREITAGIGYPLSLAFDQAGNLYVANSALNTVTEYAPGSSKVERTIGKSIVSPVDLVI